MAKNRQVMVRMNEDDYQKILLCVKVPYQVPEFCREAIKNETKRKLKQKKELL